MVLIASVPGHCLSFTFNIVIDIKHPCHSISFFVVYGQYGGGVGCRLFANVFFVAAITLYYVNKVFAFWYHMSKAF